VLDFSVAPNDDGTFDIHLGHAWEWTSRWFSGFDLSYLDPMSVDSSDTWYVATSGSSIEASADIIGIRSPGPVAFNLVFPVSLNQSLSVSAGGIRDDSNHVSSGQGIGAWSATIRTPRVSPSFDAVVDWVPVSYTYLDYTLTERPIDSVIFNVALYGGMTISALKLGGSSPRIMVGHEWNKVQDAATGDLIVDDAGSHHRFVLSLDPSFAERAA
jgi:hypothetical protein